MLALGAALLLGGCASHVQPPPAPPPPVFGPVVLAEPQIASLADLLRMEDRRELELDRWTVLARDSAPVVRARAALAAGRIGDARAGSLILAATRDSSEHVRAAAVFALGRLADTTAAATEALAAALPRGDSAALQVPAALARQNTPAAWAVLAGLLTSPGAVRTDPERALAGEALLALWRFRERPHGAELAAGFLSSPDPAVRWAAVYALSRAGTPGTLPRLLMLAGDPDPLVRATVARGLRPPVADSAGAAAASRVALGRLLADAEPHVRINAARALAAFRQPADAPALQALLRDPDQNVRIAAAESLGTLGAASAAPVLGSLAREPGALAALRAAALASLARIDTATAVVIAQERAAAPEWLERLYAVRGVATLRGPAALELLRRFGRDPDARVQGEAFGALAAADTALPLAPLFLEGLASPDPIVRANAASGLGARRDPAFLSALLQAYDRARRDTINDAALAAVDALGQLTDRGVAVATSFFARFQPATDPVIRARVAQRFGTGPGTWGEPRPIDTGRGAEFYRQVVRDEIAPVLAGGTPPRVRLASARGTMVLALDPVAAPLTVHNFLELVRSGFYRRPDLRWHRVVPNFVLQDGDPRGDGSGGPPWVIRDELNLLRYGRGTLGMALSGPDTGGSQYFITHSPQPHLDGGYTIFGRVVAGMEVADAIVQDDPILTLEVIQ